MEEQQILFKIQNLANLINYDYHDISYLKKAMHCQIIHKQGDGKNRKHYTNDELTTLGDALLKLFLTEYLYNKGYDKHNITSYKQNLEDNKTLYRLCNDSGIFKFAYNDSVFSENAPLEKQVYHSEHDVYIEAIIAAIYLDKGFDYCKRWTMDFFENHDILSC